MLCGDDFFFVMKIRIASGIRFIHFFFWSWDSNRLLIRSEALWYSYPDFSVIWGNSDDSQSRVIVWRQQWCLVRCQASCDRYEEQRDINSQSRKINNCTLWCTNVPRWLAHKWSSYLGVSNAKHAKVLCNLSDWLRPELETLEAIQRNGPIHQT